MDAQEFGEVLVAYRREQRAVLHDEGPEALMQELAELRQWLAAHALGSNSQEGRVLEMDPTFREAKAQVLEELLDRHTRRQSGE